MNDVIRAPYRLNVQLTMFALAVMVLQLVVVPLSLLPQSPVTAIVAVVLLSLTTPVNRALLHEAIHGRLARQRNWNDRLGRGLAVTSAMAFDAIRFGHLAHHRFPRHDLDRADVIEPGQNPILVGFNFYIGLLGWIHVREILGSALMLLPRRAIMFLTERALPMDDSLQVLRGAIRRSLDRRLRRSRVDLFLVASIYGAALYLYGAWWPVLIAGIAMRALIVSLQDNVAHYGTPAVLGASAHNSRLAPWPSTFLLNANLHGVHHARPELPWNALPQVPEAEQHLAGTYMTLVLRQFQGPRRSFHAPSATAREIRSVANV